MRPVLLSVLVAALLPWGCASVDVVRIQPGLLKTPRGTEPLAGIQAVCLGFYLFTLGIPEADLDKAVNELLLGEARKLGADQVIDLRFEGTPSGGIWWLTKLLGFRSATATGIAVVRQQGGEKPGTAGAPLMPPPPPPQGDLIPPQEEGP